MPPNNHTRATCHVTSLANLVTLPKAPRHEVGARPVAIDLAAGDLCTYQSGDGEFGIAKVLALDPQGVHVRLYRERIAFRPSTAKTSDLSLDSMDDPGGFGMGHLPLAKAVFGSWQPLKIGSEPVSEEEIEGYNMWLEANGGYWS